MVIYKTTNLINGKYYTGKNATNNPKYLGSGIKLERAIKKYGKENFKREILEDSIQTTELLNEREIYWIKELNATDDSVGYNIALGGDGGDLITNHPNKNEVLKNIRAANEKTARNPETRRKKSEASKRLWENENHRKLISEKMKGRKITWKDKIGATNKKKYAENPPVITEETKQKLRDKMTGHEFKSYSPDVEARICELYSECGPKRMSKKLSNEGVEISPYKIITILKKHKIYQKGRKKRPELK
jgi:hypothetical protein